MLATEATRIEQSTYFGSSGTLYKTYVVVTFRTILLRLATALTDEEVSGVIAKSLPSCLLKLNSGTEGVRKKVLELLVHVNKRVKDNHNIQLPVDALLTQYQGCLVKDSFINLD